jgi:hypothetical protein
MWMVNPKFMCVKHLNGEHLEIHMFLGTIKKGKSIKGYIEKNLCQPRSFKRRHDDIVNEMIARDYKGHKTPLEYIDCQFVCDLPIEYQYWEVNSIKSLRDLLSRCPDCLKRYEQHKNLN